MTENKGILVKNIYYMLTYAFRVLRQTNYDEIATEEFENIQDLLAAILAKGIGQQLKQGLYREYITKSENLSTMHGKIDINGTIENKLQRKQKIFCEYDDLSENNTFNQILKTTAIILMKEKTVSKKHRIALKKVILFFENVDVLEVSGIKWNLLRYQRSNQSYKMLLNICYFVLDGLLLSTDKGEYRVATFLDEQKMHSLYEKFVLEYYRYYYPVLRVYPSQIKWDTDDGMVKFLPIMQTDITITHGENTLIIDTKYYSRSMQIYRDSNTIHSNNLYQIYTYVKNRDVLNTGKVSGLILYAKTEEDIAPDSDYLMSGNKISAKTLNLNTPFSDICIQLDRIVLTYFTGITVKEAIL